jgi:hypothetical protein
MPVVLHCVMHGSEQGDVQTAAALTAAEGIVGRRRPRRKTLSRWREQRATSAWFAAAFALFLTLTASALLAGGGVVIHPLLESIAAGRDVQQVGEILFTLPDGLFCRRASFDNATGKVSAGEVEPCPIRLGGPRTAAPSGSRGFAWGGR